MAFRTELYLTVENRLKEYIENDPAGDNVSDLPLDLINRARDELRQFRKWAGLIKIASLTLTDKVATLPSDCGEILSVFYDSDSDKQPDHRYYEDTSRADNGYKITASYAKATGWSRTITFYSTPSNTPQVKYVQLLADFAGTGTEYLFFPGELLLTKAKCLYLEDDGRTTDGEYEQLEKKLNERITNFIHATQNENVEPSMEILDARGAPLDEESYSLGDGSDGSFTSEYDNDVDQGDY